MVEDPFSRFEHEGWERVAHKYDSVWSSLTRQFIPYLLDAAEVKAGMSALDVACGPGYVCEAVRKTGAISTGIDFSERMLAIARAKFPDISFTRGDAHNLPFEQASFDRVLINFGLLHFSDPEIVNDAIQVHGDLNVGLPEGPPHYLYGDKRECQKVLEQAAFDANSLKYNTRTVEWRLPSGSYFFEAERGAGVRTAGLLARQSAETLDAIRVAIENSLQRHAIGNEIVLPMAARVIVVSKP